MANIAKLAQSRSKSRRILFLEQTYARLKVNFYLFSHHGSDQTRFTSPLICNYRPLFGDKNKHKYSSPSTACHFENQTRWLSQIVHQQYTKPLYNTTYCELFLQWCKARLTSIPLEPLHTLYASLVRIVIRLPNENNAKQNVSSRLF